MFVVEVVKMTRSIAMGLENSPGESGLMAPLKAGPFLHFKPNKMKINENVGEGLGCMFICIGIALLILAIAVARNIERFFP